VTTPVKLNRAAINGVTEAVALKAMRSVARQAVKRAKAGAPKESGDGAASIGYRTFRNSTGVSVRISWDRDHFYMLFPEIGTSEMPARPFLRPALDGRFYL